MTMNGVEKEVSGKISLLELLRREGFQTERIAVEKNGEIIPKTAYEATWISETDKLEVVSFVGGG